MTERPPRRVLGAGESFKPCKRWPRARDVRGRAAVEGAGEPFRGVVWPDAGTDAAARERRALLAIRREGGGGVPENMARVLVQSPKC